MTLDKNILNDAGTAAPGSSEYADLLSLATRQVYGTMELTVGKTSDGKGWNMSDVLAFTRDMATTNTSNAV